METIEVEVELATPGTKKGEMKTFVVRELLAPETDALMDKIDAKPSERVSERVKVSSGISDEDYARLTSRGQTKLIEAYLEVSGEGFQKPAESKDSKEEKVE